MRLPAIILALVLCVTGCAHEQARRAILPPASVPVLNAVSSARVQAARLELDVPVVNRSAVANLSATLESAQSALGTFSAQVEEQSLALSAAETEVTGQATQISKLKQSLHQTAKERDFYPILFAVTAAIVTLRVFGESASRLPFGAGMLAPFLLLAAGGAVGFILSRTVAAYGSRLIP